MYYRLTDPAKADAQVGAWAFVSEDQSEVLLNAVMLQIHGNMPVSYVQLNGLESGAFYQDTKTGMVYPADALMEAGLPLPLETGEYRAYQIHFVRV